MVRLPERFRASCAFGGRLVRRLSPADSYGWCTYPIGKPATIGWKFMFDAGCLEPFPNQPSFFVRFLRVIESNNSIQALLQAGLGCNLNIEAGAGI
jgi:hypothetical protein